MITGLLAATLTLTGCGGGAETPAGGDNGTCEPVTLVGLDDGSQRSAYYALVNDKVTSEVIPDVEVNFLTIPAAIQATQTGQYDFINTSLQGAVLANQAGLDLRVAAFILAHTGGGLSLYARSDSGITSPKGLAGKTIATPSFGSTGTVETQMVLAETYGLDFALEGGEVTWTELDPPTQLNALRAGDIDAALLWNQSKYLADQDPELTNIAQLDEDFRKMTGGAWPIGAAVVAKGDYVAANPRCVSEMQRMLTESVDYAAANIADFAQEVATQSGEPVEYIETYWDPKNYTFGGKVDAEWRGYADAFYSRAANYGVISAPPDLDELVVGSE